MKVTIPKTISSVLCIYICIRYGKFIVVLSPCISNVIKDNLYHLETSLTHCSLSYVENKVVMLYCILNDNFSFSEDTICATVPQVLTYIDMNRCLIYLICGIIFPCKIYYVNHFTLRKGILKKTKIKRSDERNKKDK